MALEKDLNLLREQDLKHMNDAISRAERCNPIADRIPRVGAIIAVGDVVIGSGNRGSGSPGDDEHAEKNALAAVNDKNQLPRATVYTTLEPCTKEVRSDPLDCCTERLHLAGVKKVFIGILDPNQGVTGKGLWELQSKGIDVELFPPDLAKRIRSINDKFIKEQQTLGICITNTCDGQVIRTFDKEGTYTLEGTFLNPPGDDVFALISIGSQWWPQPYSLAVMEGRKWAAKLHFGTYGPHLLSIVRANELGITLIKHYRKIVSRITNTRKALKNYASEKGIGDVKQLLDIVGNPHSAIDMARPPKGIQVQAQVNVIIEEPPDAQ
jgi:pyrimidine deaminase RibD-like protein